MNISTKLLKAAAGQAVGAGLDVDEVFKTHLYTGTYPSLVITNNIDLSGEGGLVWIKERTGNSLGYHVFFDTERGADSSGYFKALYPNVTNAEGASTGLTSFSSNGFTVGDNAITNGNNSEYVSWTFRKAPKFFDVVTYSGTGSAQNISHNLGSVPGAIFIKRTSNAEDWLVYHRSTGNQAGTGLNETAATYTGVTAYWNSTTPTDSVFTVGTHDRVNTSGENYVAYLFAHNNNDGEFGPDSDQDIIKCGSYTEVNGADVKVDLGFEPQWIMIKVTSTTGGWGMYDVMRGWTSGSDDFALSANTSNAESNVGDRWLIHPDGFTWKNTGNTRNIIYMAIRRGPLAAPEDATKVFSTQLQNAGGTYTKTTGFVTDMIIQTDRSGAAGVHRPYDRLRGGSKYLETSSTSAEASGGTMEFDNNTGYTSVTSLNTVDWTWKRAPSYFDIVTYSGNSTGGRTVSHNLGVAPEMIWVKVRNLSSGWVVLHTGNELYLNSNAAKEANTLSFNNTDPTATSFTLGSYNSVNGSGYNYIAYLFATVAGVSKLGSITGNGSTSGDSQTIDCGFSSGARFVLIKRTSGPGGWYVFDSARGIVSGNDPFLSLQSTNAETTNVDLIDPTSSGFILNYDNGWMTNISGETYIFYAIA